MDIFSTSIAFQFHSEAEIALAFQAALRKIVKKQKSNFFVGQFLTDLKIAFTEGAANAIRHGFAIEKKGVVACVFKLTPHFFEMRIADPGKGFSLRQVPIPRFKSLSERGRGIFMMRQLMDNVEYRRGSKKNWLILKRALVGGDRESRDLDLLYEISRAILATPDLQSVYRIILDKAVEVFGAEKASILTLDRRTNRLKVAASRGLAPKTAEAISMAPGEGIAGYVFRHVKPCLIEDMEKNPSGWRKKKRYKSRSFISAPMISSPLREKQEAFGVINMTDKKNGRPFTKKDLKLLTTIANQASAYLHICRLISEAKEAESLKQELKIARQIQQGYLPTKAPGIAGLDFAGWCETAQSVGGDYYDFLSPDPENFYVVVADVSGHNIASALTMANFRSQLKSGIAKEKKVGAVLENINRLMFEDLSRNDQFISVVLARFDLKERAIDIALAGHRPPLFFKNGKISQGVAMVAGTVLGGIPDETYEPQTIPLKENEGMLFYTDGVTEMDQKGKRLGLEGLKRILKPHLNKGAPLMLAALKDELKNFRGNTLKDDVTLVTVKIGQGL